MTEPTTDELLALLGRKEVELERTRAERDRYKAHADDLQQFMLNAAQAGRRLSIEPAEPEEQSGSDAPLVVGSVSSTPAIPEVGPPILSFPVLEQSPPSGPAPPPPDRAA